jgi:DNA polymerase-3 subunit epsilon
MCKRDVHGALIDSELLALVYLAMTGGQTALSLDADEAADSTGRPAAGAVDAHKGANGAASDLKLVVIKATEEEAAAHDALLEKIANMSN